MEEFPSQIPHKLIKIIAFLLCFILAFEQTGFAQVAGQLDIAGHLGSLQSSLVQDKFRPLHLRYLAYQNNNFKLLLDKGDALKDKQLTAETKVLLNYFFIGVTLPNSTFWVNLRPDSPDNIIDNDLARTDVGRVLLEADLQLKKDTAKLTSPETPQGRLYWNKLYKKAEELFGSENITIPTLTRPWIVPAEIIIRETPTNAYIYKATLKVMLEQDYLKDSQTYSFSDPRQKALNEYSAQLIRETIIPKLNKEINSSRRYAPLRQVYYSLILAQWFKARFPLPSLRGGTKGADEAISKRIDSRNLAGLSSKETWDKATYFKEYQKSFTDGEYNIKEPVYTPTGQAIRTYTSGGVSILAIGLPMQAPQPGKTLQSAASPVVDIGGNSKRDVRQSLGDKLIGVEFGGDITTHPQIAITAPSAVLETVEVALEPASAGSPVEEGAASSAEGEAAPRRIKKWIAGITTAALILLQSVSASAYELVEKTQDNTLYMYVRFSSWATDKTNCLWHVAKRLLKDRGVSNPSVQQINSEITRIQDLNSSIKNPDLVYPHNNTGTEYLVQKIKLTPNPPSPDIPSVPSPADTTSNIPGDDSHFQLFDWATRHWEILLIVVGVIALGYLIYKAAPHFNSIGHRMSHATQNLLNRLPGRRITSRPSLYTPSVAPPQNSAEQEADSIAVDEGLDEAQRRERYTQVITDNRSRLSGEEVNRLQMRIFEHTLSSRPRERIRPDIREEALAVADEVAQQREVEPSPPVVPPSVDTPVPPPVSDMQREPIFQEHRDEPFERLLMSIDLEEKFNEFCSQAQIRQILSEQNSDISPGVKVSLKLRALVLLRRGEDIAAVTRFITETLLPALQNAEQRDGVLGPIGTEVEVMSRHNNGGYPRDEARHICEVVGLGLGRDEVIEFAIAPSYSYVTQIEVIESLKELGLIPPGQWLSLHVNTLWEQILDADQDFERHNRYIEFSKMFLYTSDERLEYFLGMWKPIQYKTDHIDPLHPIAFVVRALRDRMERLRLSNWFRVEFRSSDVMNQQGHPYYGKYKDALRMVQLFQGAHFAGFIHRRNPEFIRTRFDEALVESNELFRNEMSALSAEEYPAIGEMINRTEWSSGRNFDHSSENQPTGYLKRIMQLRRENTSLNTTLRERVANRCAAIEDILNRAEELDRIPAGGPPPENQVASSAVEEAAPKPASAASPVETVSLSYGNEWKESIRETAYFLARGLFAFAAPFLVHAVLFPGRMGRLGYLSVHNPWAMAELFALILSPALTGLIHIYHYYVRRFAEFAAREDMKDASFARKVWFFLLWSTGLSTVGGLLYQPEAVNFQYFQDNRQEFLARQFKGATGELLRQRLADLGEISDELFSLSKHPDPEVRRQALLELAKRKDSRVINFLDDDNDEIKGEARRAVEELRKSGVRIAADKDMMARLKIEAEEAFYSNLVKLDPWQALEQVDKYKDQPYAQAIIQRAAELVVERDPWEAFSRILELSDQPYAQAIIQKLVEVDPMGLLQCATRYKGQPYAQAIIQSAALRHPVAAITYASSYADQPYAKNIIARAHESIGDIESQAWQLGIERTLRFTLETLKEITQNRQNNQPDGRPLAVLVYTRYDNFNALQSNVTIYKQLIRQGYRIMYYEASDAEEVIRSVREATGKGKEPRRQQKADLIMLAAHSNMSAMRFGEREDQKLSLRHEGILKQEIGDCLKDNGRVIILGCSTGEGKESGDNIANMMRRVFPQAAFQGIFAPVSPDNLIRLEFDGNIQIRQAIFQGDTYQALMDFLDGKPAPEYIPSVSQKGQLAAQESRRLQRQSWRQDRPPYSYMQRLNVARVAQFKPPVFSSAAQAAASPVVEAAPEPASAASPVREGAGTVRMIYETDHYKRAAFIEELREAIKETDVVILEFPRELNALLQELADGKIDVDTFQQNVIAEYRRHDAIGIGLEEENKMLYAAIFNSGKRVIGADHLRNSILNTAPYEARINQALTQGDFQLAVRYFVGLYYAMAQLRLELNGDITDTIRGIRNQYPNSFVAVITGVSHSFVGNTLAQEHTPVERVYIGRPDRQPVVFRYDDALPRHFMYQITQGRRPAVPTLFVARAMLTNIWVNTMKEKGMRAQADFLKMNRAVSRLNLEEIRGILLDLGAGRRDWESIENILNQGVTPPADAAPGPASAGSPVEEGKGGIDLRSLPMTTKPALEIASSPADDLWRAPRNDETLGHSADLENEWRQINTLIQRGIIPSAERIKAYFQSCSRKEDAEKAFVCVADTLKLQEEHYQSTDACLKELLASLEAV